MRVVRVAFTLFICTLLFTGCQLSGEVENQAYVLVLGIERLEDGNIGLTALVPRIGKNAGSTEGEDSRGSPYLRFSVSGNSWPSALEALQWSTPRQVNLSHIELLVASGNIAGDPEFPELMRNMAEVSSLYTNARFAVCQGSARTFIDAGKTVIGTRMSTELKAMLKHYANQGYIPDSSFADACYAAGSIYSDPVAIWAYTADDDSNAIVTLNESQPVQVLETPMKQCFSGAAVFREGVFLETLTAEDTRLLNLIRGHRTTFCFNCKDNSYEVTPMRSVVKQVEIDNDRVKLILSIELSTQEMLCREDIRILTTDLRHALEALIQKCQAKRCDPFGFAEEAASHFVTVPEWRAFGWRDRYATAEKEIRVDIRCCSI